MPEIASLEKFFFFHPINPVIIPIVDNSKRKTKLTSESSTMLPKRAKNGTIPSTKDIIEKYLIMAFCFVS